VTQLKLAINVPAMNWSAYLRLARPLDWLKNGFVPLGLLFAEAWHQRPLVIDVALVTIAFCLAASAVYAFNDVSDADADRRHPRKRQRPVASGAISARQALIFSMSLAFLALAIAASVRAEALALVGGYLLLNLFYSRRLRRIPFVDVLTIAAGFMLRVLAGTIGVGIPPSGWLLATALALTLFLGFAKRRAELVAANGEPARASLAAYNQRLLDALTLSTAIAAGASGAGALHMAGVSRRPGRESGARADRRSVDRDFRPAVAGRDHAGDRRLHLAPRQHPLAGGANIAVLEIEQAGQSAHQAGLVVMRFSIGINHFPQQFDDLQTLLGREALVERAGEAENVGGVVV
jgi:4-hydroxybenzoate polyprenyltransferase